MAKGRFGFPEISVLGPTLAYMRRGSLLSRTRKCGFYTDYRNAFLDSPYLLLPFDMSIALVQLRYHGEM